MQPQRNRRKRRGSALVVCTIATAALSLAAIAIVRSGTRSIARLESLRSTDAGRHVAAGLTQRAIATLRNDPSASGTIIDPGNGMADATCQMTTLSPSATQIRVFLYAGSTIPASDLVIDPTSL